VEKCDTEKGSQLVKMLVAKEAEILMSGINMVDKVLPLPKMLKNYRQWAESI
jgi:hypothetical protein